MIDERNGSSAGSKSGASVLAELERVIMRMEELGRHAEDAQARVTAAIPECQSAAPLLVDALGDVIEIVTERTTLAHQARRLVIQLRDAR